MWEWKTRGTNEMEKAVQARLETKSRDSQVFETFVHQFEFSPKTAEAIIETVKEAYELHRFNPDLDIESGKIKRQVISINAKHGPRLKELSMVTVTLTLDHFEEDQEVRRQYGSRSLRHTQICRLTEEAIDQGGVLTQEDLADILKIDVRTIRRDIKYLSEQKIRVQTRGAYHDIGPTLSHKVWIVSLYLQYKTYSDIARTTRHSTTSIKRYIKDFGRVVLCVKKELSITETAHIAGISERLANKYLELFHDYNTLEYADRIEDMITLSNPSSSLKKGKKGAAQS